MKKRFWLLMGLVCLSLTGCARPENLIEQKSEVQQANRSVVFGQSDEGNIHLGSSSIQLTECFVFEKESNRYLTLKWAKITYQNLDSLLIKAEQNKQRLLISDILIEQGQPGSITFKLENNDPYVLVYFIENMNGKEYQKKIGVSVI